MDGDALADREYLAFGIRKRPSHGVSANNPAVVNGPLLPLIELGRYRNTILLFQSSEHDRVRQTGMVHGRLGHRRYDLGNGT